MAPLASSQVSPCLSQSTRTVCNFSSTAVIANFLVSRALFDHLGTFAKHPVFVLYSIRPEAGGQLIDHLGVKALAILLPWQKKEIFISYVFFVKINLLGLE